MEIIEYSVSLAADIVENGGEIARAEETIIRVCRGSGFTDINVFIIPSLVYASAVCGEERHTASKRIYANELNLGRLEEVNNAARIAAGEISNSKRSEYSYSALLRIASIMLATGAFSVYFGGSPADAFFSGVIGLVISFIPYKSKKLTAFSKTLIEATVSGILSFLPSVFGIASNPDKIMTGTIMLLIPGMSIGTAMRDMISGNPVAGIIELAEAISIALAIALGNSAALLIFGGRVIA